MSLGKKFAIEIPSQSKDIKCLACQRIYHARCATDRTMRAQPPTAQPLEAKQNKLCNLIYVLNDAPVRPMESTIFFLLSFLPLLLPATPTPLLPQDALPTKSSYLPIDATNSNSSAALFYAYYEAQRPLTPLSDTPFLVWLQGGPGYSSMIGNLFELGPWLVNTDQPTLRSNPAAWNRRFGLLFIDNPLGTGFSTTTNPDDNPWDQPTIAKHLWGAINSHVKKKKKKSGVRPRARIVNA